MFTGSLIRLSKILENMPTQITLDLGLRLCRDADIAYVGKVPTRLENRLVPAGKKEHLDAALLETGISAFVVPEALAQAVPAGAGILLSDQPVASAMAVHEYLCDLPGVQWRDFESYIHPSALVMPGAFIAPRNVRIGPETVIGPNAAIFERSVIGRGCQIGAGVVIGMEAFEQKAGARPKMLLRQSGGVMIGDYVTLLPGCTVARSTFGGFNRIGSETKVDAQTYIAHDCVIGERVTICACCDISGRVEIGDDAYLGPNCTLSNGIRIGSKATISLGAVVSRDVPDEQRVTGNFALPHEKWLKLIRDYR